MGPRLLCLTQALARTQALVWTTGSYMDTGSYVDPRLLCEPQALAWRHILTWTQTGSYCLKKVAVCRFTLIHMDSRLLYEARALMCNPAP